MSVSINNLFNYSRSLPVPFDTMTNKKVKVASMYGAKTESTLCGSVIKAVHAMCRCMNGTGEGAVGQIDTNKSVAEYKSSVGPDAYHLVVFDAASGSALASVYDKNTELIEQYVAHPSQRDGAAIFFALMPFLMSDAEFDETFQEYYDQFIAGYPDMAKATESMAILCDNAYRRIKDDTCPAHINITVDKSGNLMRVSQGQLDSGSFVPTSVTAGEFTIFAKTGPSVIKKAGVVVEHTDFVGKYPLTPGRTLSALELSLIPKLPEWYIIPPEVVDICKHAQKTTGRPIQMRNFLLRGPAGTGKTMGAKAIAAGLGLPYMKYTCSANTEIFDFTGMIFPETDAVSTGSSELDREREILKSMRKRVNVFLVMEDWAVNGEHGNDCEAFSDYDDAKRIMTNRIREELEDGSVPSWRESSIFAENSSMDFYEAYLDGEYMENHYKIMIIRQPLMMSSRYIREVGGVYKAQCQTEDFISQIEQWDEVAALSDAQYQRLITNPMIPECIERHLGRNDHYWEAYWESVSEAAHGLVRQASKQPDCFTPEADNPYPLCIGSGKSECDDCCLYLHMKGEGGYEC